MMPTEKEVTALHGGSNIDLDKFLKLIQEQPKKILQDDIVKAFKVFDKDKSGNIPSGDLKHALITLADKLTEAEADLFIKLGGGEKINYKEYLNNLSQYK